MKRKHYDISDIQEDWDILAAHDIYIRAFSPIHFRVDGRLDVYPTTRTAYDVLHKLHYDFPNKTPSEFALEALHHVCV